MEQEIEQPVAESNENQPVTLKPEAIEPKSAKVDENVSNIPYHTKETAQIAADRAEELKNQEDKPYEYKVNGYTVTEFEDTPKIAAGDKPGELIDGEKTTKYKVTADGFEKVFIGKREAEIFVETHAIEFKDMPATFPST